MPRTLDDAPACAISIIVPAFNLARFLPQALQSALSQDIDDIEIVVRDDASTDATPEAVRPFLSEPRIRYVRNPENLGVVANVNAGFAAARGERVLLLSADDVLLPGALKRLNALLDEYPGAGYAYGSYLLIDTAGLPIGMMGHPGHLPCDTPPTREDLADLLAFDHYAFLGATLFRAETLKRHGGFDAALAIDGQARFFRATDWDLLLRLSQAGVGGAFTTAPVASFRVRRDQASNNDEYHQQGIPFRETLVIQRRYLTEDNRYRIAGRENWIWRDLNRKAEWFNQQCAINLSAEDTAAINAQYTAIERFLRALADDPLDRDEAGMPLSLVILSGGDIARLNKTLGSAAASGIAFEAVLVVNVSSFDLGDFCRKHPRRSAEQLHLPRADVRTALNHAVDCVRAGHVMFLREGAEHTPETFGQCRQRVAAPGNTMVAAPIPSVRRHAWLRERASGGGRIEHIVNALARPVSVP